MPAFNVENQFDGVRDLRANRRVGEFDACLENTTCQARDGLMCGVGVDRR